MAFSTLEVWELPPVAHNAVANKYSAATPIGEMIDLCRRFKSAQLFAS
jgi:hypothetical protein